MERKKQRQRNGKRKKQSERGRERKDKLKKNIKYE